MSRATTFLAGVLLFLLVALGIAVYRHLPTLLERQAETFLAPYGVHEVRLGKLKPGLETIRIDTLTVTGAADGIAFTASMSGLELGYQWRQLMRGELNTVALAELDMTARATVATSKPLARAVSVAALLPGALLRGVPTRALAIETWKLHYQPVAAAALTATGSLQLGQEWELQLQVADLRGLALQGLVRGAQSEALEVELQLQFAELAVADIRASLNPTEQASWRWSLEGSLQYSPSLAWLQRQNWYPLSASAVSALAGHTEFTASIEHPDTLDLEAAAWQQNLTQFGVRGRASNKIDDIALAGTVFDGSGNFRAALVLQNGLLDVEVQALDLAATLHTAQLQLAPQMQRWLHWDEHLRVRWNSPGTIAVTGASTGSWSVQLRDALLTLGNTESGLRWEALSINAALNLQEPTLSSVQLSANLKSRAQTHQLPELRLKLNHPGEKARHLFDLTVVDAAQSLGFSAQAALAGDGGNLGYQANLRSLDLARASKTLVPLLRKFKILDETLEIRSGTFNVSSRFGGNGLALHEKQPRSDLAIQGLDGTFGEYRFSGVDLVANWSGIDQWQTNQPINFSMESFFAGVQLTDTRALISLPDPTPIAQPLVRIEQFSSRLFGGRLYQTQAQQWDFSAASNSIRLLAEDLQLSSIVALQNTQDISALGILDGELPVTFAAGRLMIDDGYLRARAPGGTIRYVANERGAALATSSPKLAMAIDLLSDFHYQKLASAVDLDSAGILLLKLNLAGSNPQQHGGRRIEFNINLEQNIDPLLQSLRLGNNVVKQLDKRLR